MRRKARIAACAGAALVVLWCAGLARFAATIPDHVEDAGRSTDAIVVLTGGAQRLESGLALLAAGKAKMLFVSGVHRGVEISEMLRNTTASKTDLDCCIVLGHEADNTDGNARETAQWMKREGFRSLRLVTGNYHMPRSLLDFQRAMPDVEIVPNPVFPAVFRDQPWWRTRAGIGIVTVEYGKYLVTLVHGDFLAGTSNGAGA